MKQWPPPNVSGTSTTLKPDLQPGAWNCIIGKKKLAAKQQPEGAYAPSDAQMMPAAQATPMGAGPAPQQMQHNGTIPTTEKEAKNAGCKAGCYTGCVECALCTLVRPSHEYDPAIITTPELQAAHEKGALQGRACACVACLPTFYACSIM